jgi:POT family proton-dependent oligopeptide transporter
MQRAGNNPDETVKANLLFLVGAYMLHTFGELCLSPIGLSMVTKLSPVKLASLMMGVWFMSSFVANIAGGFIASYASKMGAMSIFVVIAIISIVLGLLLMSLNKWLVKMSHGKL